MITEKQIAIMRRAELARRRARKRVMIDGASMQAKHAKAKLIITGKGKNGRSMSRELLAKHGINPKGTR